MIKCYDYEECEYNGQPDCALPDGAQCPHGVPTVPPVTNADKIRAMSDHDLAVFLEHAMYDSSEPDWMTVLSWLQQPAEEET